MAQLNLNPNEVLVLKNENVSCGSTKIGQTGELILTNQDLIYILKGTFGGVKNIVRFPLNQIKIYDGKPQVACRRNQSGYVELDVYFNNSQEVFLFYQSLSKKEGAKWINEIYRILTGTLPDEDITGRLTAIPGAEYVAETLKGTVDVFKKSFGFKTAEEENSNVTRKCVSCSAPLSGRRGQRVHCRYCDTDQVL